MAIGLGEGAYQGPQGIMAGLAQVLDSSNPDLYRAMQLAQQKKAAQDQAIAKQRAKYESDRLEAGESYLSPLNDAVYNSIQAYDLETQQAIAASEDAGTTIPREKQFELSQKRRQIELGMNKAKRYTKYVDERRKEFEKDPTVDEGYFMQQAVELAKQKGYSVSEGDLDVIAKDHRLYRPDKVAEDVASSIQASDFEEMDISPEGIVSTQTKDVKGYKTYIDENGNRRLATRNKVDDEGNVIGQEYIKEWSSDDMKNAMGRADVRALVNKRVNDMRESAGEPPVTGNTPMTDEELKLAFNALMSGQSQADINKQYQVNQMAAIRARGAQQRYTAKMKASLGDKKEQERAKSIKKFAWHVQNGDKDFIDRFKQNKDIRDAEYDRLNEKLILTMEPKGKDESPYTREIDLSAENSGGFSEIIKYAPYKGVDPDVLESIPAYKPDTPPIDSKEAERLSDMRDNQITNYVKGIGLSDFEGIEVEDVDGNRKTVIRASYNPGFIDENGRQIGAIRLHFDEGGMFGEGDYISISADDRGRIHKLLKKNNMFGRGKGMSGIDIEFGGSGIRRQKSK